MLTTVYQYQRINRLSLQNLAQRKLWASLPTAFNDPFEFRLNRAGIINQLDSFRTKNPELQDLSDQELSHLVSKKIEDDLRKFGVMCFTENPTDILMWAHYADCHRGMCLGFELDEQAYRGGMFRVEYTDDYSVPDLTLGWNVNGFGKVLRTKSTHWAYEKELRSLNTNGEGLYDYPGKLSNVIFGCRCHVEDRQKITTILASESDIDYYLAQLSDNSYTIDLQKIEQSD